MPRLKFVTVDVFTSTPFEGNPLAICFIRGVELPEEVFQKVAREFNLSETVFVYDTQEAHDTSTWNFRIFTTEAELPFAGHPTIGTAWYLLTTFERQSAKLICNAGEIAITLKDGRAYADIPCNYREHAQPLGKDEIRALQPGLTNPELILSIATVSPVKGMTFVVTELASLEALTAVQTTGKRPEAELDDGWNVGFVGTAYYVAIESAGSSLQYRTRMIEANMEDPATGSMSCGLASFLASKKKLTEASFHFVQGVEMGRESHIHIDLVMRNDEVERLSLSGDAALVMNGQIRY